MARDTRDRLLEQGLESFMHKGFNNTGIQEVLHTVGVPKGSFYHYFKSKNDFGIQVLERYCQNSREFARAIFEDEHKTSLQKFHDFFDEISNKLAESGFRGGCFLGNMAQEMGDLCEEFERLLEQKMHDLRALFVACIEEGQKNGEISNPTDPHMLADFLLNGWQGAMLRMKVAKNSGPLDTYRRVIFQSVLV